jgi:hypothetical protein
MAFTNPFFSIAGQKERIANVGSVLNIAFNPFRSDQETKIVSSVGGTVGKAIETVANHPYATAAAATIVLKPAAAFSAARAAIAPLSTKTKVIAAAAAIPVTTFVAGSKKAQKAITSAPSQLAAFGSNAAKLVEDPSISNLKNVITESPLIVAGLATVGVLAATPVVAGAVSSYVTLQEQKKQTKAFEQGVAIAEKQLNQPNVQSVPIPLAPEIVGPAPIIADSTSPLTQQTKEIEKIGRKQIAKKKKKRKIYKEVPFKNIVRIANVNNIRAG